MHFLAMLIGLGVTIAVGTFILIAVILLGLGLTPLEVVTVLVVIAVVGTVLSYFVFRKLAEATARFYRQFRKSPGKAA
jgi:uncharacterized membrane protein